MVLDGLAADEEPLGDLGVGQSLAEQAEHVVLAPGEQLAATDLGGATFAPQLAQQRRSRRRRTERPRASRTSRSAARASLMATSGCLPANARASSRRHSARLERQLHLGEALDRVPQPRPGVAFAGARPRASASTAAAYGVGCASAQAASAAIEAPLAPPADASCASISSASSGMHVLLPGSERWTACSSRSRARRVLTRARWSAARGSDRLGVVAEPVQQRGRLVVPPCLTRRSASRTSAPALSVRLPSAHSRTASVSAIVGLRPAAGCGEDAAVVGAAVRPHRRQLPALGDLLADADPLLGTADVLGVLAGGEQLAEDLLDDDEVLDLTTGHRGQRLVEQQHALLDAVVMDQARAEVGQRGEGQVGDHRCAADVDGRAKCSSFLALFSSNMPSVSATQPRSLLSGRSVRRVFARASQPPATAQSPAVVPYM